MPLLSRKDLVKYFAEMMVVVLGILIAFQVDEWREGLQIDRDLQAALVRLKEESQTNLRHCEIVVPIGERLARSLQLVLKSIQLGRLRDADIGEFEYGLTHIGWLPGRPFLTTVAEEMIATGLLKELNNVGLQTDIASTLIQTELRSEIIAIQSRFLQSIVDELARTVEYSYGGETELNELRQPMTMGLFEDGIEVAYDFASLANNRYLRNLLFETTDGYIDMYQTNYAICARFKKIVDQLAAQGD